jgi:uncharacterized protein YndB with AHSA1/START domain
MTDSYELTREIYIKAQPETVFSYLTVESKMKEWYGEIVEADPKPGGIFRVAKNDGTADCRGQYLEVIPYKKVVYNWGGIEGIEPGESIVEIFLEPKGSEGTQLKLRHYNVRLKSAADSFGRGWKEYALPLLKTISEGGILDGLCFESGRECGAS